MRIGVDIDGVISDSYPVWLQELNRHYGKNITVLEDYEMHLVFDVPWDDMNQFFVQNTEKLLTMPKPIPGAIAGIETLINEGHEVIYLTARTPEEEEVTLRWFAQYAVPYERILFTGFQSKADLAKKWSMEAFIEDYLVNARAIAATGIPVFLYNTSYNQGELPPKVTRCYNWEQVLSGIRRLQMIKGLY